MIDLTKEKRLSLCAAGRLLGMGWATIRKMIDRGQLEGVVLGGRLYTSVEAIQRAQSPPETATDMPRSTARKTKESQRAEELLDEAGW